MRRGADTGKTDGVCSHRRAVLVVPSPPQSHASLSGIPFTVQPQGANERVSWLGVVAVV
ncbi:hypothetical protein E2C01_082266 [Portunus trituberculatus]|uniref:Uncharacterized protein n=1 Tax=Portunus trituberculatus TaxID=210409 RepID=A0A5B7IY04_PORTR|nr:hypothetical protein [Portunus trituberculatus]